MQLRVIGNDDKTVEALFVQDMLEKLIAGIFCLLHYPSSTRLRETMGTGSFDWQQFASLAHVRFLWHDEITTGDALDQYLDSLPKNREEEKSMPLAQHSGGFPGGNTMVVTAGARRGASNSMARTCHAHFVSLITSERHAGFRAAVEAWMMGQLAEEAALALDGVLPRESVTSCGSGHRNRL